MARAYWLESEEQEQQLLLSLRNKVREYERSLQKNFSICPTYSCNFQCAYCFEKPNPKKEATLVDLPALFRGLDLFAEYLNLAKKPALVLYGGEPLLKKNFHLIHNILETGTKKGFQFSVVSNGYHLDYFMDLLKKHRDNLIYTQVTIDGPEDIHNSRRQLAGGDGTFKKIMANVHAALKTGIPIHIRTNVDVENIPSIPQLGKTIRSKGLHKFEYFSAYLATVADSCGLNIKDLLMEDQLIIKYKKLKETPENIKNLSIFDESTLFSLLSHLDAVIIKKNDMVLPNFRFCEATQGKNFVFGADGFIYPCFKSMGNKKSAIGRFIPGFQIYGDRLDQWLQRDIINLKKCSQCSYATICGGGCAYEMLLKHDTLMEPNCPPVKEIVTNYLKFLEPHIISKYDLSSSKQHIALSDA